MNTYRRDDVLPEWEPVPYTLTGPAADEQERGFHSRAIKPIVWLSVPYKDFPAGGILGYDKSWFSSRDVTFWATYDDENLLLVQLPWHGFPDPPEWGLHSRPVNSKDTPWSSWGHVPVLPTAWLLPSTDT